MNYLQREKAFDVIICGGGAAGMSAALWCDDLNLSALLLEARGELGGQLLSVHNPIENHLGAAAARNGREMRDRFVGQIKERKFELKLSSRILSIDLKEKSVSLESGEKFTARFLIAATGVGRRKLNVRGEREFSGKGIIESGKRDRDFVENKTAAVVGGGDAAFENALILAGGSEEEKEETAAKKVFLIQRGADFRARAEFVKSVSEHPNIEILTETIVREIGGGGDRLELIRLENLRTKRVFNLPVEALLIRVGVEPNTEIFRSKLNLDARGYIRTNAFGETSVEGVFAAGDAANPVSPTLSSAVGMGATVVKAIYKRLNS